MSFLLTAAGVLAGLVVAGALYQAALARRDTLRFVPPGRLVDAAGYRIHVHALGSGPAVVFISGIAASCLNWTRVQSRLAAHATVVTSDRAGLGWSDLGPPGLTAHDHAEHLRVALDRVGVQPPFVLVGHSYGGYVAQLFASRHEAEVDGLVLVDPITWQEWIGPGAGQRRLLLGGQVFAWAGALLASLGVIRFTVNRYRRGSEATGRALLGAFGREATRAVSRVMGEIGKMPPEVWDAVQAHWTRPRSFVAMARHFATLTESAAEVRESEASGSPWRFPLVVLSAAETTAQTKEAQQAVAARSIRGRFLSVPGSGHWIHLDQPEVVEETIKLILAGHLKGRRPEGRVPLWPLTSDLWSP